MREGSAEPVVRRHYTWPVSFDERLQKLKERRGAMSYTEVIRAAIALLEAVTDILERDPEAELYVVDAKTGEKRLLVLSI